MPTDLPDDNGLTALTMASGQGLVAVVRVLLEAGVDKDLAAKNGFTALMFACGSSQAEVVRLLLEARADTSVADNNGFTAFSIASGQGNLEVTRLLLEAGAQNSTGSKHFIALTLRKVIFKSCVYCRSFWGECSKPIASMCSP